MKKILIFVLGLLTVIFGAYKLSKNTPVANNNPTRNNSLVNKSSTNNSYNASQKPYTNSQTKTTAVS